MISPPAAAAAATLSLIRAHTMHTMMSWPRNCYWSVQHDHQVVCRGGVLGQTVEKLPLLGRLRQRLHQGLCVSVVVVLSPALQAAALGSCGSQGGSGVVLQDQSDHCTSSFSGHPGTRCNAYPELKCMHSHIVLFPCDMSLFFSIEAVHVSHSIFRFAYWSYMSTRIACERFPSKHSNA